MKNMRLTLIVMSWVGISLTAQSQETIPASGGGASGSGGTVSYSVGQFCYTTDNASTGSVAQGIQQPYEIFVITGIHQADGITLAITAYPNPATSFLLLKTGSSAPEVLVYKMFDLNGKLIMNGKIEKSETEIDVSGLVPATYFLTVQNGNKEIKTFKIIKK